MPIKKPKSVKMPMPFADQHASEDDDARRRALLMKREMEEAEGFSWNAPQQGIVARLRAQPRHKMVAAIISLGMAGGLIGAFFIAMDSGIRVPDRLVYMESWPTTRSSEDAVSDREEAMDKLRAQVAANRRAYDAEQARLKALDAERAAARQASS